MSRCGGVIFLGDSLFLPEGRELYTGRPKRGGEAVLPASWPLLISTGTHSIQAKEPSRVHQPTARCGQPLSSNGSLMILIKNQVSTRNKVNSYTVRRTLHFVNSSSSPPPLHHSPRILRHCPTTTLLPRVFVRFSPQHVPKKDKTHTSHTQTKTLLYPYIRPLFSCQ